MNQTGERKFGLITSIAMIVGIVIGSGIFFKTDDILIQTNGSVILGCVALVIGAIGIVFGGITMAEWAKITDDAGGLISYTEKAYGKYFAFLLGWFQSIVYFPLLTAVISWVAGNYTIALFPWLNLDGSGVWLVTLAYIIILYSMHALSSKMSGHFQSLSMIIKLIPLILIAVLGIIFGNPSTDSLSGLSMTTIIAASSAIVSVGFSYDGWTIAPSICHEIKNAKRNLPLALIISPLIILAVYLAYFLGINFLIGSDVIMAERDLAVNIAATKLFGPVGAKLILVTVIISVLGTVNGVSLGGTRIPYSLAIRNEIPFSDRIKKLHPKYDISLPSVLICFILTLFWCGVNYLTTAIPRLAQMEIDLSSIPIIIMYVFYTLLYIGVIIRTNKKLITNKLVGYVCPVLAIFGSITVVYGGFTSNNSLIYLIVSILLLISGHIVYQRMSGAKAR